MKLNVNPNPPPIEEIYQLSVESKKSLEEQWVEYFQIPEVVEYINKDIHKQASRGFFSTRINGDDLMRIKYPPEGFSLSPRRLTKVLKALYPGYRIKVTNYEPSWRNGFNAWTIIIFSWG